MIRLFTVKPHLNRFISGRKFYQRKKIEVAFVAKKEFTEELLCLPYSHFCYTPIQSMPEIIEKTDLIYQVRGKGLLNAILVNDTPESPTAWNICMQLAENGLLAKPTHGNIIRFAPPLIITKEQLQDCISIIEKVILNYKA